LYTSHAQRANSCFATLHRQSAAGKLRSKGYRRWVEDGL
jgi:hypothetical protein